MMSQINSESSRNLYEFGDYMKKQLNMTIVLASLTLVLGLAVAINSIGLLAIGSIGILIVAIIVLIFEIMMLIRLSRAKTASPHPNLVKIFQFLIVNFVLGVVSTFISNAFIGLVVSIARSIIVLMAWKSLAEYVAIYGREVPPSNGFQLVADGIKMYTIATYVEIGTTIVSNLIAFTGSLGLAIVMVIVAFGTAIYSVVSAYKLANGIKEVFGAPPPAASPYPSQPMYSGQQPGYTPPAPAYTPQAEPNTTIQPTNAGPVYCPNCGGAVESGGKFCGLCGTTMNK